MKIFSFHRTSKAGDAFFSKSKISPVTSLRLKSDRNTNSTDVLLIPSLPSPVKSMPATSSLDLWDSYFKLSKHHTQDLETAHFHINYRKVYLNPVLDHVFSVFLLPALWCHNCTSPPVKGAHPGKGICATSRFILVSLKPLLNFQQHLSLENMCWAQRWELHPSQNAIHPKTPSIPVSLKPDLSLRAQPWSSQG